jgi:hypothetical protein
MGKIQNKIVIFPIPEKELQTTRSSLLHAHRFTIYELQVPTTTLNFAITFYCKKNSSQEPPIEMQQFLM